MGLRTRRRQPVDQAMQRRLAEEAIQRYVDWREEIAAVDKAYGDWSNAPAAEGALSFAAFNAALDREERAATLYGTVVDRLERLLGVELEPAAAPSGAA